jgi:uncharacterized protein
MGLGVGWRFDAAILAVFSGADLLGFIALTILPASILRQSNRDLMHPYLLSLSGGLLIGASVWLMLAGLGRVTGISGIVATALTSPKESLWRYAFLAGLIGGGLLFVRLLGSVSSGVANTPWLVVAGLLVGFGTVLGGGCTSGHGVCGLGRRSPRSLIATLTFMAAGMATVAIIRALNGGAA